MAAHPAGASPTLLARLQALVQLARPGNVAMAGLGVLVGATVSLPALPTVDVLLAAVATMSVTAGGNALNDLTDQAIDATAHPRRPLPSGRLARGHAWALVGATFLFALAAAYPISWLLVSVVAGAELLLVAYEAWFKAGGLLGNAVVGLAVGATFPVGALAAGGLGPAVGFLSGSAMLSTVAREVWKDQEDLEHDRGRRTLAQRRGPKVAHRVAQVATVGAVVLSPLPALYGFGGAAFLVAVALADLVFLAAIVQPTPSRAQRVSKVGMLTALLAFLVGALA